MIKDTNSKIQGALRGSQRVENSGFIRLIVLIVIIIGVMVYFKIQPQEVWDKYLKPIIDWGIEAIKDTFQFIMSIIPWLIKTIKGFYNA